MNIPKRASENHDSERGEVATGPPPMRYLYGLTSLIKNDNDIDRRSPLQANRMLALGHQNEPDRFGTTLVTKRGDRTELLDDSIRTPTPTISQLLASRARLH
jgi:hypothetical protein